MSEAAIRLPQSVNGGSESEASANLSASADSYHVDIRHFQNIGSELTAFLSALSEKVRNSADQLKAVGQAVEQKQEELKRLRQIEAAASSLENLLEKHRVEKEQFESSMVCLRGEWEAEKALHDRETEEYTAQRHAERQREEEEYRRRQAAERSQARKELEEELQSIRKKNREKQESLEKSLSERELLLKQKESEWMQLVQELEQFMSKLGKGANPD